MQVNHPLVINTQSAPPRGETYVWENRVWACATDPGESLPDVLAHIAAQLLECGLDPDHPVRVKPIGAPAWPLAPLKSLGCQI